MVNQDVDKKRLLSITNASGRTISIRDLTKQKFGRLTPLHYIGNSEWLCQCECGNTKRIDRRSLTSGRSKSCGCWNSELASTRSKTHGLSLTGQRRHPIYRVFDSMVHRCYNPKNKSYANYGGRGIYISEEWRHNKQAFFDWSFANGYEESLSIDRIDNDGPYAPWNCRWTTYKVNGRNTRGNVKQWTYGEFICQSEACEKYGVSIHRFFTLVSKHGATFEQAIEHIKANPYRSKWV